MLKNYIVIAIRNLLKQKGYSAINIFGLAIGLTCCMLILTYIHEEVNFDNFHPNYERTYRIALDRKFPDNQFFYARTPMPMGPTLTSDFPEVEEATRMFNNFGTLTFRKQDQFFDERRVLAVDSNFTHFFKVEFISGDWETALALPNSVVMTRQTAHKYFGATDPLGQQLELENTGPVVVRGVVEAMPSNTHFKFDMLLSLNTFPNLSNNQFWGSYLCYTYIRLEENATISSLESNMPEFLKSYIEPQLQNVLGISFADYEAAGNKHNYFFQRLRDIHLTSNLQWELEPNSSHQFVYLLGGISVFVLLLACINFMNLSTALSAGRSREVGMRKVLGARKKELVGQFLTESVLMCFLSLIVAIGLVAIAMPYFNELTDKSIVLGKFLSLDITLYMGLFILILGTITGIYPSFFLSSFQPLTALKGKVLTGNKSSMLRNGLVIFQFAVSIVLVIGTILIHRQLAYMNNRDLGFAKDQLVVVERADLLGTNVETWINEISADPNIIKASGVNTVPGRRFFGATFMDVQGDASDRFLINNLTGDYDLVETMGLEIVSGRGFDPTMASDSNAVVLNEAAARTFKWADPINKELRPINGNSFKVIGVVKDFNFESLHQEITPLTIFATDLGAQPSNLVVAKINTGDITSALGSMSAAWEKLVPQRPFDYTFVNEEFGALYAAEQRSMRIFTTFSFLAILIACLGAFGLSAFMASQKTREVGVRKVLGASVPNVLALLSKDFALLIAVANIIAWPIAYYGINWWLENFAFAVGIEWWTFPLAAVLSLLISLAAVSYHTVTAALKNPVETLRQE